MQGSRVFRGVAGAIAAVTVILGALLLPGCAQSFVAVRNESHPTHATYLVDATIEEWPNGYYSTSITIRNVATDPLALTASMFRLEGSGSTSFVQAGHMPMFLGRAGYRMPLTVEPRSSGTGEIYWGIRGTPVPFGPVRLVVTLPDGEHSFEFELID